MKKGLKKLLSLVTLVSLTGCAPEVGTSSSSNGGNTSGGLRPTEQALANKLGAVKDNVKEILAGDKLGLTFDMSLVEHADVVMGEQKEVLTDGSMEMKQVSNIDVAASKKYYDAQVDGEWTHDEMHAIALEDTSKQYTKMVQYGTAIDNLGDAHKMTSTMEVWNTPTKTYTFNAQEVEGFPEESYEYYSTYGAEDDEYYYEGMYATYESIQAIREVLNATNTDVEMPPIVNSFDAFMDGNKTAEELFNEFIVFYNSMQVEEADKIDPADMPVETKNLILGILDSLVKIDYYALYQLDLESKDGVDTFSIKLNLNGIVAALNEIIKGVEAGIADVADTDETKMMINQMLTVLKADLVGNLPSTFNVGGSISFKDNMIVGVEAVTKVNGNVPTFLLMLLGSIPSSPSPQNATSEVPVMTYNINMELDVDLNISNTYAEIPAIDESKFVETVA